MFHPLINGADPSAAPETSLPQGRGGPQKTYSKLHSTRTRAAAESRAWAAPARRSPAR